MLQENFLCGNGSKGGREGGIIDGVSGSPYKLCPFLGGGKREENHHIFYAIVLGSSMALNICLAFQPTFGQWLWILIKFKVHCVILLTTDLKTFLFTVSTL